MIHSEKLFSVPFYLEPGNNFDPNHQTVVNFCKWVNCLTQKELDRLYEKHYIFDEESINLYVLSRRIIGPGLTDLIYLRSVGITLPRAIFEIVGMHELVKQSYEFQNLKFFDVKRLQ
jgi:hypothetical protein